MPKTQLREAKTVVFTNFLLIQLNLKAFVELGFSSFLSGRHLKLHLKPHSFEKIHLFRFLFPTCTGHLQQQCCHCCKCGPRHQPVLTSYTDLVKSFSFLDQVKRAFTVFANIQSLCNRFAAIKNPLKATIIKGNMSELWAYRRIGTLSKCYTAFELVSVFFYALHIP